MKPRLSLQRMESQAALELPDRETLQVVIVITIADVLSGNTINIDVSNINVANQVCTLVDAMNVVIASDTNNQLVCSFNANPMPPY